MGLVYRLAKWKFRGWPCNLGAGRVVTKILTRINQAIADGDFF